MVLGGHVAYRAVFTEQAESGWAILGIDIISPTNGRAVAAGLAQQVASSPQGTPIPN
jgi:hypothetical protein